MSKEKFIMEFTKRCGQMRNALDVARTWLFMDITLEKQGWLADRGLALQLCRIQTDHQAKKKIVTHFESANLWL